MRYTYVLLILTMVFGFFLMKTEGEIVQKELDHYCEMVELFDETDGEYGWPDYKGLVGKTCNDV